MIATEAYVVTTSAADVAGAVWYTLPVERVRRELLRRSRALETGREGEALDLLCALGRQSDARAASESFLRTYPRSLLAARVSASCGAP